MKDPLLILGDWEREMALIDSNDLKLRRFFGNNKMPLPTDAVFNHDGICTNYPRLQSEFTSNAFECVFNRKLSKTDFMVLFCRKYGSQFVNLSAMIYDKAKPCTDLHTSVEVLPDDYIYFKKH